MLVDKKTKIVATLGPKTEKKKTKTKMVKNGVNVFRINFSHADYDSVKTQVKQIREISKELNVGIAILADLQGPKLRIGKVEDGTFLNDGDILTFSTIEKVVTTNQNKQAYITYKQLPKDVKTGEIILVDDGKIQLEVIKTNAINTVKTKVIEGGALSSKKGVNLPNTKISLPALTGKDKKDLKFALEQGVDWIALSFVRSANDLILLNDYIKKLSDYKTPVIAKIEKPEAVANIDEIIKHCDGLMVARGDLGIELPIEQVPLIQKKLVYLAKLNSKPVIIATQMMESMIESAIPTRAEVNDVANSVMDGADAVMLSGETSVGKHPVKVIKRMTKIIQQVEDSSLIKTPDKPPVEKNERYISEIVCYNAAQIASNIHAKAITTLTASGYSAITISSWRPKSKILVFTANRRLLDMLSLLWGVTPFFYNKRESTDQTIKDIEKIAMENDLIRENDMLVNVTSMPLNEKGMVNTLRITKV